MLRGMVYPKLKAPLEATAAFLARAGVHPNQLTFTGLAVTVVAALLLAYGHFLSGGIALLAAGFCDMLDGALARSSGKVSAFGAFADSVADRYSDFFVLSGGLLYYARAGNIPHVILVLVVILGSLLTSYAKARAENLIARCDVGLIERAERILLIAAGAILNLFIPVLWFLAITSHLTVFQRILHTWKETGGARKD